MHVGDGEETSMTGRACAGGRDAPSRLQNDNFRNNRAFQRQSHARPALANAVV